jgi:hypothetical protein
VLVHCMENHCRNNVGDWPTREVAAPRGAARSRCSEHRRDSNYGGRARWKAIVVSL